MQLGDLSIARGEIQRYGAGAGFLDDDASGYEIVNSTNLLFTNLLPRMGYVAGTLIEHRMTDSSAITVTHSPSWRYRQTGIALYKSGRLNDRVMKH